MQGPFLLRFHPWYQAESLNHPREMSLGPACRIPGSQLGGAVTLRCVGSRRLPPAPARGLLSRNFQGSLSEAIEGSTWTDKGWLSRAPHGLQVPGFCLGPPSRPSMGLRVCRAPCCGEAAGA